MNHDMHVIHLRMPCKVSQNMHAANEINGKDEIAFRAAGSVMKVIMNLGSLS